MDASDVLALLFHGNQLKRTPRTGWVQRGITDAESVAAHSYGAAFIAMVMTEVIAEPLNMQTVLAMAVLHDLPEGLTTDIPTPAWKFLPPGIKVDVERSAMQAIVGGLPFREFLLTYWEELHRNESAEARLVHDCDKLDMFLQAFMYEKQTGSRQLSEFWDHAYEFEFEESRALFEELASLRLQE